MENETEVKRAICKFCLEVNTLREWHDCLSWYGKPVRQIFKSEDVASKGDVKEGLKRNNKYRKKSNEMVG